MQVHMPVYCDTANPVMLAGISIAEPVNFISNVFILLAAILAVRHLRGHRGSGGTWALVVLLFMTATGSFAWHGFRTAFTLLLDTWSGIAFLVTLAGVWVGVLYSPRAGLAAAAGFVLAAIAIFAVGFIWVMPLGGVAVRLVFVPFFGLVVAVGWWLTAATWRRHRGAGRLALSVLLSGVLAAVGRSADLFLCHQIRFGTHFLWHMFLSLAAYLAIVMLVKLIGRGRVALRGH